MKTEGSLEKSGTRVRAAVIGAAGLTGVELTRLLLDHPNFDLTVVTSTSDAGKRVDDLYPGIARTNLTYVAPDLESIAKNNDLAFLAVPHTAAMDIAPFLLERGLKVVDVSADFRLSDAKTYEKWYGTPHKAPALLDEAAYGLPELFPLSTARLVACAGCYPTATLLAAAPAIEAKIVTSQRIIVDAKSGVSGAGREARADSMYISVTESIGAYKVASHRHTPEITQGVVSLGLEGARIVFSPHLAPMSRGLLSTVYLEVDPKIDTKAALAIYKARYEKCPFITVHPAGRMPKTSEVRGSNRAHIGLVVDDNSHTLVVTSAIDNLVKGASGQAVQCANLLFGFEETTGLATHGAIA